MELETIYLVFQTNFKLCESEKKNGLFLVYFEVSTLKTEINQKAFWMTKSISTRA